MAQVSLRKPTNPTKNTVDILRTHSQKVDEQDAMSYLLHMDTKASELLPLHETEKTWADKFVASNRRLRRLFEDKVRTLE